MLDNPDCISVVANELTDEKKCTSQDATGIKDVLSRYTDASKGIEIVANYMKILRNDMKIVGNCIKDEVLDRDLQDFLASVTHVYELSDDYITHYTQLYKDYNVSLDRTAQLTEEVQYRAGLWQSKSDENH